jgi:uncharacterized protein
LPGENLEERAVRYVTARRCRTGGFCFYELDEPNGSDTYYALSVLTLLGIDSRDDATLRYLKSLQKENGSYDNFFMAYFAIKSLSILQDNPTYDPVTWVKKSIMNCALYPAGQPIGMISVFNSLYCVIALCSALNARLDENTTKGIIELILTFQKVDKGFGHIRSTLLETSQALQSLKRLGYPVETLGAKDFIRKCEVADYGFTGVPNTSLAYLDQVHGGLTACALLSYKPRHMEQCSRFIRDCQRNDGGFSRRRGISTLEDTYYAVHSLSLISALKSL